MDRRYVVGEVLNIWITGEVGDYRAVVVPGGTPEQPRLRVLMTHGNHIDSSWPTLKGEDYIIRGG